MGYRMFCDRCEKETDRNYVSQRQLIVFDGWTAEIMIAYKGAYNNGVLCGDCLFEIITKGEKLPDLGR